MYSNAKLCAEKRVLYGREERIRRIARERRRQAVRRQRLGLMLGLLVITASFTVLSGFSHPGRVKDAYLYYTAVTVDRGDTLYGIASEYVNQQPHSLSRYIDEIMELNNMKAPTVYYGQVLIIPYYSKELK